MFRKLIFSRFLAILFFLFAFNASASAKVTVQPNFKGTLLVTTPDGDIEMYDEGEAVPDIPSNSVLEVFGGKFTVATETGDKVNCSCLNHKAAVGAGSSVSFACEEESGALKVLKGSVPLVDAEGKEFTIAEGKEYLIKAGAVPKIAPATEAAEEIGEPATEADRDFPPFDTRTRDTSPSR